MINITVTEIITSFIMYGIIHASWTGVKWGLKHLETEAGQIIATHVKAGHSSRFKHCVKDNCATPAVGTVPDLPLQAGH